MANVFVSSGEWEAVTGSTRWGAYVAQRLGELERGEGDFTGLKRPAAATVAHAREVAGYLRPSTPTPSVVPTEDGEVAFIWRKNGHDVEITVSEARADLWARERKTDTEWGAVLPDHRGCCLQRILDALEAGS